MGWKPFFMSFSFLKPDLVGTSVGISVGTAEGTSVGASVGISVRASVGAAVGTDGCKAVWHKYSIEFGVAKNRMDRENPDRHKFSIHFGSLNNPMDCKNVLWHKFYIHFRIRLIPMVCEEFLLCKASSHLRSYVKFDGAIVRQRQNKPHPYQVICRIRWGASTKQAFCAPSDLKKIPRRWAPATSSTKLNQSQTSSTKLNQSQSSSTNLTNKKKSPILTTKSCAQVLNNKIV